MTWVDWIIAAVLLVGVPIRGIFARRELQKNVSAGRPDARASQYAWAMASQWSMTLILLTIWIVAARPLDTLGLVWPSGAAVWWTLLIVSGVAALFAMQVASVRGSADALAKVRAQLETRPFVRLILPTSRRELRIFTALAATAGFCEEVLFRGFLFWFFSTLLPLPAAIAIAVVAFGIGHAYQGVRDVLLTGTVGAVALGCYLLTGSLVAPIAMHAILDFANGLTGYLALRDA